MTIDIETVTTVVSSVVSWIVSKKYIFPYIKQAFEWIRNYKKEKDKENIDSSKELLEIKDKSNDVYENQLQFCMKQISDLQTVLTLKQSEINDYINQLSDLRNKIVDLQKQLYDSQMKYSKLSSLCCSNKECQFRQSCNE